jgi:hypothetical protein
VPLLSYQKRYEKIDQVSLLARCTIRAPTHRHCPKEVVAMRRVIITKKLLQQCMMDSVNDDVEGRVLHKLVMNCLRKRRVLKSRKLGCRARRWRQRKSWDNFSADSTE